VCLGLELSAQQVRVPELAQVPKRGEPCPSVLALVGLRVRLCPFLPGALAL
jgi:hypothetical protein